MILTTTHTTIQIDDVPYHPNLGQRLITHINKNPIESVSITKLNLENHEWISLLDAICQKTDLKTLHLPDLPAGLLDQILDRLSKHQQLESLELNFSRLTQQSIEKLATILRNNPGITQLDLRAGKVNVLSLTELISAIHLREKFSFFAAMLNIDDYLTLGQAVKASNKRIKYFANLNRTAYDFSVLKIGSSGDYIGNFSSEVNSPTLKLYLQSGLFEQITVSSFNIKSDDIRILLSNSQIKKLSLNNCVLDSGALYELGKSLEKLDHLDLSGSKIGAYGIYVLAPHIAKSNLQTLNLSHCGINGLYNSTEHDEYDEPEMFFNHLLSGKLRELNLSGNPLKVIWYVEIKYSSGQKYYKEVEAPLFEFMSSAVKRNAEGAFKELLKLLSDNTHLTHLDISGTKMPTPGFISLVKNNCVELKITATIEGKPQVFSVKLPESAAEVDAFVKGAPPPYTTNDLASAPKPFGVQNKPNF